MAADAQPEPVEWGTSFGRFGADSSERTESEGRSTHRDASTRRGRFGASGATTERAGTKEKSRGGSSRGKKRFGASSSDSPFGPVVGSSADEAPDSGSAGGGSSVGGAWSGSGTNGAELGDAASPGSSRRRSAGSRREGKSSRPRGSRTTTRTLSFEEGAGGDDPDVTNSIEPPPSEPRKSREEWTSEARGILLRQLALAPRSRHQLATKLADRDIPSDVAISLLDRFEEVKLIDDAEFAHLWVRTRTTGKSLSRSAIRRELADRGIDGELAEDALLEVSDEDEHLRAREVVLRRARSTTDLSDRQARDKEVRRLVGMLARKGYSPGVGFSIVRDVLDELASGHSVE